MEYCPHCLMPNVSGNYCKKCGGKLSWTNQKGLDLPVGTVLTSRDGSRQYWVGAAKSRGHIGITYGAIEIHSQRRVAIQEYFPHPYACRDSDGIHLQIHSGQEIFPEGMRQFLSEGWTLSQHGDLPHVVHALDGLQANNTAYLVMEYLEGQSLLETVLHGGPIPAQALLQNLEPVIRDLGVVHRSGLLHRDISPGNLVQIPGGPLRLMNFGFARETSFEAEEDQILVPPCKAIERIRLKGLGPWTDIYALAATIYYCITGKEAIHAMERRLSKEPQPSPRGLGADLTAAQEEALLWALSVQPQDRPQSVDVFYQALYVPAPPKEKPLPPGILYP